MLVFVILLTIIVIGFLVYRSRNSGNGLQVEPHAREEIDKAKRR